MMMFNGHGEPPMPPSLAEPPERRTHARGLLSELFFGRSSSSYEPSPSPMPIMMGPSNNNNNSNASTGLPTPIPTPVGGSSEPAFWRTLPNLTELISLLNALRTFTLTSLSAEDMALLRSLQQLCYYFLGGTHPAGTAAAAPALFRSYPDLEAQYQKMPPRQDLTELLKHVVDDTLTQPYPTDPKFVAQRTLLAAFYPHIMVLIQGLMMHLYVTSLVQPADKDAVGIVHLWYGVLGNLDALRIVVVHASEQGLIDLGDAPRFWKDFIKQTVDDIQRCLANVHRADSFAVMLKSQLSMRDQAMDELRRQYDPSAFKLEMIQGQRACAMEALRNVTSVLSVLHNASSLVARGGAPNNNNNNTPAASASSSAMFSF
jgi:hypothetical protein